MISSMGSAAARGLQTLSRGLKNSQMPKNVAGQATSRLLSGSGSSTGKLTYKLLLKIEPESEQAPYSATIKTTYQDGRNAGAILPEKVSISKLTPNSDIEIALEIAKTIDAIDLRDDIEKTLEAADKFVKESFMEFSDEPEKQLTNKSEQDTTADQMSAFKAKQKEYTMPSFRYSSDP